MARWQLSLAALTLVVCSQAVAWALDQADFMRAVVGNEDALWQKMNSFFTPETPPEVRAMIQREGRSHVLQTEGGHISFAATDALEAAVLERMALIPDKMPGVEEIVTRMPPPGCAVVHLLQATGLLWTARRAAGRAMQRLPMDPNWDSGGMRMELVR